MAGLSKRGGIYHLRMRVPRRFQPLGRKGEIHRSLYTDSEIRARELLPAVKAQVLEELEAQLIINEGRNPAEAYTAAQKIVEARGFRYKRSQDLLAGPLEEILTRLDSLTPKDSAQAAQALLGGVEAPTLRLSELPDEVERLMANETKFKNARQYRVWKNPLVRAATNLRAALAEKGDPAAADKPVLEITREDALRHRNWWKAKIARENLSAETANKDFTHMASMLKHYYDSIEMVDPPAPYAQIRLTDRHAKNTRKLEIPVDWIREQWFAPGALDDLTPEARDILLISIETGCRQSEIHDAPPGAFVLDAPIPHILIANEDGDAKREIKNVPSQRKVPLVGVALAAAKRNPDGFPRYRGKASYSNTVNKHLRAKVLMPSEKHTIGGTRHAWESRLKDAGVQSDDRAEMMGHSVRSARNREVYGDEMPLAKKLELANLAALPVPDHLA